MGLSGLISKPILGSSNPSWGVTAISLEISILSVCSR